MFHADPARGVFVFQHELAYETFARHGKSYEIRRAGTLRGHIHQNAGIRYGFEKHAFYAVVRVFGGAVVSYLFAVMLNRKVWGRKIFRTLIYIPAIIPMVGSAIVWQALFDESFSFFNYILSLLHLPEVDWLGKNAMGSVMLMSIWCGIGPTMIIILAALQTVPQELLEAAEIDGAGGFRKT